MATLPYMQLYVADYLADTVHLDTDEHGAYLLLLMNYWQTEKPIPVSRLQKITKLSNERWSVVEQTLNEFFTLTENGCWLHERVESDLQKVKTKSIKASRAGKKSAEKRRLQSTENKGNSNKRSTNSERTLNHKDKDKDKDKDKNNKKQGQKRFAPPSVNDVQQYLDEKGITSFTGQQFVDFYVSKGWMIGKNKMKSWQHAVTTWVNRRSNSNEENKRTGNKSEYSKRLDAFDRATAAAYDD